MSAIDVKADVEEAPQQETREDLINKVEMYNSQLEQINNVLATDPRNEDYLKIKNDLGYLIALTNNLIEATGGDDDSDEEVDGNGDVDNDMAFKKNVIQQKTNSVCINDRVEVKTQGRVYAAVVVGVDADSTTGTETSAGTGTCTVRYYEYGDSLVSIPTSAAAHISPVERGAYTEDDLKKLPVKCECRYATDGKWYEAAVQSRTK